MLALTYPRSSTHPMVQPLNNLCEA